MQYFQAYFIFTEAATCHFWLTNIVRHGILHNKCNTLCDNSSLILSLTDIATCQLWLSSIFQPMAFRNVFKCRFPAFTCLHNKSSMPMLRLFNTFCNMPCLHSVLHILSHMNVLMHTFLLISCVLYNLQHAMFAWETFSHINICSTNLVFFCGIFPLIFCVLYNLQHVSFDLQTNSYIRFCTILFFYGIFPLIFRDLYNLYMPHATFDLRTLLDMNILHNKSNILCDNFSVILSLTDTVTCHF